MKNFVKNYFPGLFFRLKRMKRHLEFRRAHGGAEYRAKRALVGRYGQRVLGGPFAGMRYGDDVACSAYVAKLAGTYEEELHPIIDELIAKKCARIIDVGCAEGYYAVGLAARIPLASIYAFDTDESARWYCAQLAKLNLVCDRVVLGGLCDHLLLRNLCVAGTAVFCDCEGFELKLLDPILVPELIRTIIIVELHEFLIPGVTDTIISRFRISHDIQLIDARDRRTENYRILDVVDPQDRAYAVREGRPAAMQWAYMKPLAVVQ